MEIVGADNNNFYCKTTEPTRWDSIAYAAYGDAGRMADLLDANPKIGISEWIPSGYVIKCPIILDAASNPLPSQMPEWKKGVSFQNAIS